MEGQAGSIPLFSHATRTFIVLSVCQDMKDSLRAPGVICTEKSLPFFLVWASSPHFRRKQHKSFVIDASIGVKSCWAVVVLTMAIGAEQSVRGNVSASDALKSFLSSIN